MAKKRKIPNRRSKVRTHIQQSPMFQRSPMSQQSSLPQRLTLAPIDKRISIETFVGEQRDQAELSEDDAMELAWQMHPDLDKLRLKDRLPDELIDDQGNLWSPTMHIQMHTIVERQLANGEPKGIAELAIRFEQEGILDSHEIRHALASAVGDELWRASQEGTLFELDSYRENVHRNYQRFCVAKTG